MEAARVENLITQRVGAKGPNEGPDASLLKDSNELCYLLMHFDRFEQFSSALKN